MNTPLKPGEMDSEMGMVQHLNRTVEQGRRASRRGRWRWSAALALLLIISSWVYIGTAAGGQLSNLFSWRAWHLATTFVRQFTGAGQAHPAFLSASAWLDAIHLSLQTLVMSVVAAGLAGSGMILTVIPAARTTADGTLSLQKTWWGMALFGFLRLLYIIARAVPELVWAMLIVFVLQPGILAGAIALAIHNFGILGKLCAEVIEDLDLRPPRAIRSAGGSTAQILFYAVLPQAAPRFLTYVLYRWEVIIRTTVVVGFVSASGLGRRFQLAMNYFHYTEVALLVLCYVLLVFLVDGISGALRWLAR